MTTRTCATSGHEGKAAQYTVNDAPACQSCYRTARRNAERGDAPRLKPGPKPDPTKKYSRHNPNSHHKTAETSTQCNAGHAWVEGSHKLRGDGKRICLVCISERKGDTCKNGHPRAEFENKYGACRECARLNARANHLASQYKLTLEQFDDKLASQDYKCAICHGELDFDKHGGVCIDHDHACCPGQTTCGLCVRDVLCGDCNQGLGRFKDHPEVLDAAASYIRKHK